MGGHKVGIQWRIGADRNGEMEDEGPALENNLTSSAGQHFTF